MSKFDITIRCYAEQKDGFWIAVCPRFTLAAQGDDFEEAKLHLEEQIRSYVFEALTIDRKHAGALLTRKAPFSLRWRYTLARLKERVGAGYQHCARTFLEPVPILVERPAVA